MATKTKTLDLLHETIKVRFVDHPHYGDGKEVWGDWDSATRTITIGEASEERQRCSLLHEILHASINIHGGQASDSEDVEENHVRAIELGLVHLWRMPANRWAVKFLFLDEGL